MKKLKIKILFILPLFLAFYFGFLNNEIKAQSLGLSIYPPLLEVMIRPGKTITQVYQLANKGTTDLTLTSRLIPFEPADEFGNVRLKTEEYLPENEKNWFSFQNADLNLGDNFTLKAGNEQQIVFKIRIPENTQEDDHYLTLLFESLPEPNLNQSAAQSKIKIGSNLLLTISETGEPPRKAEIVEFKIDNAWFQLGSWQFTDSFANPKFILRIKNIGRNFFKPMGIINVKGWSKQEYVLDLLPENILINSVRQSQCFSSQENKPLKCQLSTGWKTKFLIGPYQAQISFGLDKISEDYQQNLNFFAFPFILTVIFLLAFLIFWLVKIKVILKLKMFLTSFAKSYQIKKE